MSLVIWGLACRIKDSIKYLEVKGKDHHFREDIYGRTIRKKCKPVGLCRTLEGELTYDKETIWSIYRYSYVYSFEHADVLYFYGK